MEAGQEAGLLGRRRELELVQRVAAPEGPGCVLIVGEAGIGKTSLWLAAVEHARRQGFAVRTARPAEAEVAFGFSALGDLLADVGDERLAALPPPQRQALEAALLLREAAEPPSPYAVAAGCLGVLRQEEATVLVAVDDVQWIDPSSAAVLEYVLRRAEPATLKFLLAERADAPSALDLGDRQVETVPLTGLTFGATQHLLNRKIGLDLPRSLARRVHETSGGNPFFALELGAAIGDARDDTRRELTLPSSLLELLGDRLHNLTPAAERTVLAVALRADLSRERIVAMLGDDEAIDEAIAADALVMVGGRVRLAHPLIGSAIVERAAETERRELSARLADTAESPEERAHHRARSTEPPSDEIALELELASADAHRRGAAFQAAELAEEGARFAESTELRARLLLRASELRVDEADLTAAARAAEAAFAICPDGPQRAQACLMIADSLRGEAGLGWNARALEHARDDPQLHVRALMSRVGLLTVDLVTEVEEAAELAHEAVARAEETGDPELLAFASAEASWPTALRGEDIEPLLARTPRRDGRLFDDPVRLRGVRAMWRGQATLARDCFVDGLERSRVLGEVWSEFTFLHHLVELAIRVGDASALERVVEELELHPAGAMASGGRSRGRAFLAALRGDATAADERVTTLLEGPHERWQLLEMTRARGIAHLLAGDLDQAVSDLEAVAVSLRAAGILEPGAFPASPDLVEALVRLGSPPDARRELAWLEDRSREQEHPWGLAVSARARGLLRELEGELAEAESALRESLDRHAELELPLDEARTRLALGRVVRHAGRRREARTLLAEAAEQLEQLGSVPLAESARDELASLGGRRSSQGLTPAEERVARLVAEGLTNQEVAAKLVVTVRTVEANLTRVYAKLGVRSRAQLTRRLAGGV